MEQDGRLAFLRFRRLFGRLPGCTSDECARGTLWRTFVGVVAYTPHCMASTRLTASGTSTLTRCFAGEISVNDDSGMPS